VYVTLTVTPHGVAVESVTFNGQPVTLDSSGVAIIAVNTNGTYVAEAVSSAGGIFTEFIEITNILVA